MNDLPAPASTQPLTLRILRSIERFLSVETASGVILLAAAAIALIWANSPWAHSYEVLWGTPRALGLPGFSVVQPLNFWVNDVLMTVFFFVVGLEIRDEMHEGALSDPRVAILPLVAAAAGVLVPALIYLALNANPVTHAGWAIPTATDIAFAVGALSLIGNNMPPALRMLLLTLAIVDDIAAIVVIACFYSTGISVAGLLIAGAGVLVTLGLQRAGICSVFGYLLPGLAVWMGMHRAGIHPTLAGVVLGLLTPVTAAGAQNPCTALRERLHPWVAYGIMPLFALANAGVTLAGLRLSGPGQLTLGSGIILGLALGKPLGIVLASIASVRLRLCTLPDGVTWRHILLLGCLGGIGFTMSLFIANLAFPDHALLATAKFAVLLASTLAALIGLAIGRQIGKPEERETLRA